MLKGPLTSGRKKAKVFGHFGHRPMPHSVVVLGWGARVARETWGSHIATLALFTAAVDAVKEEDGWMGSPTKDDRGTEM